jgi:hypothetical protein
MLIGYFLLLKKRIVLGSKLWLVGGNLFFDGYWSVVYIPLLLLSIFVNFFVGSAFASEYKIQDIKKTTSNFWNTFQCYTARLFSNKVLQFYSFKCHYC